MVGPPVSRKVFFLFFFWNQLANWWLLNTSVHVDVSLWVTPSLSACKFWRKKKKKKKLRPSDVLKKTFSYHVVPPDFVSCLWAPFDSVTLSKGSQGKKKKTTTVGVCGWGKKYLKKKKKKLNKDICFQLRCHHRRQHLGLVTPSARRWWRGGGGGGGWGYLEVEEKEMLSRRLNEGRFTQNNDGWTRGFTADVYLKRDGKYSFGTEGVICRYTYQPPHPSPHTPPLQPLAPTWGPRLSAPSPFYSVWKGGNTWGLICSTLWERPPNGHRSQEDSQQLEF